MDWSVVIGIVSPLLCAGGVLYMVVEKWMDKPKTNAEVKQLDENAKQESIDTGLQALQFHAEFEAVIEARVTKALTPVLDNQKKIVAELQDIKDNWCCYREQCEMRIKHKDMVDFTGYEED